MIHLSESQTLEFAKLLEEYEDDIADINTKKAATLDDIRHALRGLGLKGSDLSLELGRLRDAAADHRLMRVNKKKYDQKVEKREGSDFYLFLLTKKSSRTHEADFSAPAHTPHDADTGEIIEQNATRPGAAEIIPQLPVSRVNRPEGDRASEPGTDEACRSEVKALAPNPEPGAGVESMGNGARENPAETMPEPNLGHAAGRSAEDGPVSAEGGSPSHAENLEAIPSRLADEPFVPTGVEIPAFLKRATTDQVGRA
jgi:hypothetical protein